MPACLDLRSWLEHLQKQDRLAIMKPGRQLEFEIAGIANRWDGNKASVFPKLGNRIGTVVSGLLSQREWMAQALGVSNSELLGHFQSAAAKPLPWHEVENPPCQQVVHDDPDLTSLLPIPTHNEHDNGAYITAGLVIVRNPRTGRQNVAIHRLQVQSPKQLGALLLPRHTLAFQELAEQSGEDLDVAIVIGSSPAALLCSQAIAPLDQDELEIAGALVGAPLEVAKCLGSDIRVPATSEIIIEGRFVANKRELEGPFGEFPQYYAERAKRHVIEVDRVTTRENPVYHTIVGGSREHLLLGGIPREATILSTLQHSFPCVKDVHLPLAASCRYHLYVQIKKRNEGESKNVILGALAAHYDVKHVFVVDEDVDIHAPGQIEWALATRFQADKDLVKVEGTLGSKLDPSTDDDGICTKLGFDLTVPLDVPEMKYLRIRVPGQDDIVLSDVADENADLSTLLN